MCGRVASIGDVEYGSMLKIYWTKTLSRDLPNAPPHYNGAPGQDYPTADRVSREPMRGLPAESRPTRIRAGLPRRLISQPDGARHAPEAHGALRHVLRGDPSRLGPVGPEAKTAVPYEAVVSVWPTVEDDGTLGLHKAAGLRARHPKRIGPRLRDGSGCEGHGEQEERQQLHRRGSAQLRSFYLTRLYQLQRPADSSAQCARGLWPPLLGTTV